jgi:ABC-type phosphate transport system permease subunit
MVSAPPPWSAEPYVMEEKARPPESKYEEKLPKWLIVLIASILAVFLVYLLVILIFPSMNIGMNP